MSNNIIYLLNHYFNNNDFVHFVTIMSNIDINYNDYLNCIIKDDVLKISKSVLEDIKSNVSKKNLIEILSEHFSKHDFKYFISKISNIKNNIYYNAYLKCLSNKNIYSIVDNITNHIEKKLDNDLDKSFYSKRSPLEIDNISTYLLLNNDSNLVNYYFKKMNKLFKDEVVRVKGTNNNFLDVKITEDINFNSNSFSKFYFGKIIHGAINENTDVFIKSEPLIPHRLSKFRKYYDYQIPNEVRIMNNINKNCYNSITAKLYGYNNISKGLIEGDIDRCLLITERLGEDLRIVKKKNYSVNFIKNLCIYILNALQTIHSCNLKEFVSYVHCDIKPANIVFTKDSKNPIKIIDFGFTLNVFNNNKRDLNAVTFGGTTTYMSISQHEDEILDYMFDFQAIAWILLYFLGLEIDNPNTKDIKLKNIHVFKKFFVDNYNDENFINDIKTDKLTKNNILVIGELCSYTINRADKKDRYETDKKSANGYYCDYNEQYYIDFKNILNKLK